MKQHKHPLSLVLKAASLLTLFSGATFAGTTAYRDIILADNPIVYYQFDETSGTTAANSATTGSTYTGTISTAGGSVTVGQPSFGQGGTAYDFGGGFVGSASALTSSLSEWTVEAWVNYDPNKTSASNFLSNDQGGWNDDVLFGIGAETGAVGVGAGQVGLVHQGNPGSIREVVGSTIDAGSWYHVVITGSETAGALQLYVNGVLADSNTDLANGATFNGADGFLGATAHLTIGAARPDSTDGGYRPYDGLLDEVAIYGSVLDAATILAHYNAGNSTAGTPPVISALSPADGASDALLSSDLVATLTEPLVLTGAGSVTIRNLTLGAGSDTVINLPDARVSVAGAQLTINPSTDLDLNTQYAVRISADAVQDQAGDAFAGILDDSTWNFTTIAEIDTTAPALASTVPADNSILLDRTANLVATFDEPVALTGNGTVTLRNLTLGSGADLVITLPNAQVTVSGSDLTINPTADLNDDTAYAVRISADAVEDLSGNPFAGILNDTDWNFSIPAEAPEGGVAPGAWTLVVLPDTQKYAEFYPGVFSAQTAWIRDNVRLRNIRYVLHLGDIVDNNNDTEWTRARTSIRVLDGAVPYTLVGGNHDYGPGGGASTRDTLMNDYFSYAKTAAWPTFGGAMEVGKLDNTYHLFEAGGTEWIIFNLEWGPRDSTIAWARGIYDQYPTRKGILITHAYMYSDNTRYDWATKGSSQSWNPHDPVYSTPGGVNDGQELWDKFVKDYNFAMTLNGHVLNDGTGYLLENNLAGDPVHQMLINYQMRTLGGEAYMRILEFHPDGQTVKVSSYSPLEENFLTAADHQFDFTLPLGAADADSDGVLDYYDPDYDTDADGVNNYDEFVIHGTHSDKADSDGDGIGDAEEIAGGTDPLRNDAATVSLIQGDPVGFDLFTEQMILDLSPDTTFRVEGSEVSIDLQMRSSPDLTNWFDEGDPVNWTTPKPADKQFYRLQLGPNAPAP
ncbi:Ig-like domain-containing protein [Haloferula sp. A504]|uniref:Ig-like domain-containing protein n=1 Tax=Haloferula sp. A504 TaxID=3373601 RepID=UPI0031C68597|nr:Ig-like domain-containing protein [Verrucomicrobiaceae bacterium E54]